MKIIRLIIPGRPIGKRSPRFVRRGKFVLTYNPQETDEGRWLLSAREQFKPVMNGALFQGPVEMHAVFYMPIPKSASKKKREAMIANEIKHIVKPDRSNLIKFAEDCLSGELWRDDSQIYTGMEQKRYAEEPRTILIIKGE